MDSYLLILTMQHQYFLIRIGTRFSSLASKGRYSRAGAGPTSTGIDTSKPTSNLNGVTQIMALVNRVWRKKVFFQLYMISIVFY